MTMIDIWKIRLYSLFTKLWALFASFILIWIILQTKRLADLIHIITMYTSHSFYMHLKDHTNNDTIHTYLNMEPPETNCNHRQNYLKLTNRIWNRLFFFYTVTLFNAICLISLLSCKPPCNNQCSVTVWWKTKQTRDHMPVVAFAWVFPCRDCMFLQMVFNFHCKRFSRVFSIVWTTLNNLPLSEGLEPWNEL